MGEDAALEAARHSGVPDQLARLNVFRLLLRRSAPAKALSDLLLSLLTGEALEHRLRELVIMRIAWVTQSSYEWAQHWGIATRFGVTEGVLVGVRNWKEFAGFGEAERAVLAATDECLETGEVGAVQLEAVRTQLGEDATLELLIALGTWTMLSTVLRSAAVPLDEDLPLWPPDGRRPHV